MDYFNDIPDGTASTFNVTLVNDEDMLELMVQGYVFQVTDRRPWHMHC